MYCKNCGSELEEGALFCTKCGTHKDSTDKYLYCEKCGAQISEDAAFCTECGTAIPDKILENRKKLLQEEREKVKKQDMKTIKLFFGIIIIITIFCVLVLVMS